MQAAGVVANMEPQAAQVAQVVVAPEQVQPMV